MCFVNNCIEKNQNKTYFEEGTSESPQDETDEFSEKCQTAFDPHPSKPSKIGVTIYGCIYASRYEGQIERNTATRFPEKGTILRGGGGGQRPFVTFPVMLLYKSRAFHRFLRYVGVNQAIFKLSYGICTCIDVLISSMFLKVVNHCSFLYEMNCCY